MYIAVRSAGEVVGTSVDARLSTSKSPSWGGTVRFPRSVSVKRPAAREDRLPGVAIVNLVATADLGQAVRLESLGLAEGFTYDRGVYHCAYLKDVGTKGKVCIFASGKLISVGTRDLPSAASDIKYAASRMAELGLVSNPTPGVKVQNIVAVADLGEPINLERAAQSLPDILYEPEEFPGAIWRPPQLGEATLLIFGNGKVVCTGLKQLGSLRVARRILAGLRSIR